MIVSVMIVKLICIFESLTLVTYELLLINSYMVVGLGNWSNYHFLTTDYTWTLTMKLLLYKQ